MNSMSVKQRVIFSLCMAFVMSFCMSGVMAFVNLGFADHFFAVWMHSWAISFCVAAPLSYLLPPFIVRLMCRIGVC